MNTHYLINNTTTKEQRRIASGEHKITSVEGVQCITIPLDKYMKLLDDQQALKKRKKK